MSFVLDAEVVIPIILKVNPFVPIVEDFKLQAYGSNFDYYDK